MKSKISTRFYIDKVKLARSPIIMSVSFDGKRLRIGTGISIEPLKWDDKREKVKSSALNASQLNSKLENISSHTKKIYYEQIGAGSNPTIEEIKNGIKEYFTPKIDVKVEKIMNFWDYYDEFIESRKNNVKFSHRIIQMYNTVKIHLKDFHNATRWKIDFDSLDDKFYEKFTSYLILKKELTSNTVGGIIKTLKTFLRYAFKNGYHTNSKFMDFKVWKLETSDIALSFEELDNLERLDLSDNKRLNKIRDVFLLQIYTGLRVSDLLNLKPENFDLKEGVIKVDIIKTKEPLRIPIHPKLQKLLQKYPDLHFPFMSDVKYNLYLKELGEKADINEPTQEIKYYGNKRIESTKPKYEMISSHTARRSFITLSLKMGILPEQIMQISGHKDRRSFQKYVKIAQNEALNAINNAWK